MNASAAWSASGSNGIGILFVHGFTGSPASLRPWAEFFADRGYSVELPLLAGHGTSPEDLNRTPWPAWYADAESAYLRLKSDHEKVFVFALSMGGALALRLGALHDPDGIVLVNPLIHFTGVNRVLIPIVSKLVSTRPAVGNDIKKQGVDEHAYNKTPLKAVNSMLGLLSDTRSKASNVKAPLLAFRSVEDHVLPASNLQWILANVGSTPKREIVLTDSYHVATIDNDAPTIYAESLGFVEGLK